MKNLITAALISLMAMSVTAGGMPEELIEPTKTVLETIEVVSPASDTVTVNPFDQLMQFVFMALFMVILSLAILLLSLFYHLKLSSILVQPV